MLYSSAVFYCIYLSSSLSRLSLFLTLSRNKVVIKTNKCEEVSAVRQEATHLVGVIGTKTRYEQQALYYLCGWVAHKLNVSTCSECSQSLSDSTPTLPQADFTVLKSYGGLIHPSKQLVDVLTKAEDVFMASDKKSASVEALVAQLLSTSLFLDSCSVHGDLTKRALKR